MADPVNPPDPVIVSPPPIPSPDVDYYVVWGTHIPKTLANRVMLITAMILLFVAGNRGWLTVDQIKQVLNTISPGDSTSVTETTTVKKTGENPPAIEEVKTPKVESPAASITPEQMQQWIAIFKPFIQPVIEEIVKDIQHKPDVTPPNNPPNTNPPSNPPPGVTPPDSSVLKLVITDEQGKPVTSMTVDTNQILQVTLSGATGKVVWNVTTVGNVSHPALPMNLGYSIELRDTTSWVSIHAVDLGSGQSVSSRITANLGGQPPPVVVTPPVVTPPDNPPPNVFPPGSRKFSLAIVEDPKVARSVTTMSIMNNLKARKELTEKGHVVTQTVPANSSDPSAVYAVQQKTPLPALVIQDASTHQFVTAVPLPTDFGLSVLAGIGG